MAQPNSINTKNGDLQVPVFMPDATRGLVKLLSSQELKKAGTEAIVVNTYHLYLQPGVEIIKEAGGAHNFMDWNRPILSDSGGFQVFSLIHNNPKMGKIEEDKVIFTSPLNGKKLEFTPEKSIQIQFDLGVDMMVCLDDCPPNDTRPENMELSVKRTIKWAAKCKNEYEKQLKRRKIPTERRPLLFSVIQGGDDIELRKRCARELCDIGFDGYGFGAMPLNAEGEFNDQLLKKVAELIPDNSLKLALGVGNPEDIVKCFGWGWDMFDCVIPTREGRHGKLMFRNKENELYSQNFYDSLNIVNAKFKKDFSSINKDSSLKELNNYSRAYLHHLFRIKDPLGYRLASLNNLEFYSRLMKELKEQKNG
jgi:queuine tRNA-ribosyltransferase